MIKQLLGTALTGAALMGGLAATAPAQAATAPTKAAAVSHVEFQSRILLNGVLTTVVAKAKGVSNGSAVGIDFDNNSSQAQWTYVPEPDNFVGRYKLRATEFNTNPLCLDGSNGVVSVRVCNGSLAQLWRYSGSSGITNFAVGGFTTLTSGPVFLASMFLAPSGTPGQLHLSRKFIQD